MTEERVVTITRAALERIDAERRSSGTPEALLRIGISRRRGPTFDYQFVLIDQTGQEPDDVTVDYPKLRVIIEPRILELLRGATVDVAPTGESITLTNPKRGLEGQNRTAYARCVRSRDQSQRADARRTHDNARCEGRHCVHRDGWRLPGMRHARRDTVAVD